MNVLGVLGHRWISEYALTTLKTLPPCYITEVIFDDGSRKPIAEIKGNERSIRAVEVFFKDRNQDKDPFRYEVYTDLHTCFVNRFFDDCLMRHRNPEDVEKRSILVSERDLKKMRQDVYWRVRKTLGLKDVSCEQYEKTDIYMYRNEFKQEGFERLCEFIKNADPDGIGISIRLHIDNANGDQLEKTLIDLAMIEASMG